MLTYESLVIRANSFEQTLADANNELIAPIPFEDEEQRRLLLLVGGNCGFTSEVLRQLLLRDGYEATTVIQRDIGAANFDDHVFVEVQTRDGAAYVDPTYLQGMYSFGLSPMDFFDWHQVGGRELPAKTLTFRAESYDGAAMHTARIVTALQCQIAEFVDKPESVPEEAKVVSFLTKLYDPQTLQPYNQPLEKVIPIAHFLADYQPGTLTIHALSRLLKARIMQMTEE